LQEGIIPILGRAIQTVLTVSFARIGAAKSLRAGEQTIKAQHVTVTEVGQALAASKNGLHAMRPLTAL
jgi:hypothetical protein